MNDLVLVPPPLRLRVPVRTFVVPELLNGIWTCVVAVPTDFWNMDPINALLKAAVPPKTKFITTSFWQSHIPSLLITAPVPVWIPPAPVQVVVPAVWRIREPLTLLAVAPLIFKGPFVFVVPVPVIVPPVHVEAPEIVTVSVPCKVPPDIDSVVELIASPLEKFAIPPDTTIALPAFETAPARSKFAVAPLTVVPAVAA